MIIAGGGTGGHLFPGVAVAEAFRKREANNEVLFVGTGRPLEVRVLSKYGFPYRTINVEGIKGRAWSKIVRATIKLPISVMQSARILRQYRPQVVLGVGGYAAGPVVLVAFLFRIPTAVAEQNTVPGITNRVLGRFVDKVFASFPDYEGFFPKKKVMVTGNPIRADLIERVESEKKTEGERFSILVFGGSQGAKVINHTMIQTIEFLKDLKDDLYFIHQTGEADRGIVAEAYEKNGFAAHVVPFIEDMARAYGRADLLVCRAGATTVAEITAIGKAAIFIPFAQAVGDHQALNARALFEEGAGEMILERDLSPRVLADRIRHFYGDREAISRMEERARKLGHPQAAEIIVDALYDLVKARSGKES